ncbi:MAG: DUF3047 domain-containing protein [Balneolaceae bacterium]|nr:DUF3047 domain-containing protein [Balneolaceae bacterium]
MNSLKRVSFIVLCITTIPLAVFSQSIEEDVSAPLEVTNDGQIVIEDFEDAPIGGLPSGWYNRDIKRRADHPEERKLFHYSVEEENGNRFLHYEHTDARHLNFPLGKRKNIDIYETPILSWKWRVNKLPENANEDSDDRNDAAASIYFVFDMGRVALFKKVPKSIRYTWSSTLPKGHEASRFFGNQKIVVIESGEDEMGKWIKVERNLVEDYKHLFGDKPPKRPLAILILSDGNSTHSPAEADYDDIMLKPKGKQSYSNESKKGSQ